MADQNEQNIEVQGKAPKMPLGVAMDMAEYAVKGKSAKERKMLEKNLPANDNAKLTASNDKSKSKVSNDNTKPLNEKGGKLNLTPQQKEIVERLNAAKSSQQRVEIFATIADDIGLDPLISLIPELGDAGSSIVSGIYLMFEAKKAGLGATSYLKIIGLQVADFFVGAIPVVGDIADYFFKANKWSSSSFEKKTQELVKEARKAGVPEEEIAKITASADKLPKLVNHAVNIYKTTQGKSKEAEPKMNQAA